MKQLLFLLLSPCFAIAQYQGNANQKITLGEQTTADGLVWRGRLADTANLLTNKLDTSVYIVLDTGTRAMWYYRVSTTPKWTRLVDSLNNLQGQLSLTSKVTGTLPVANGGTNTSTAFTAGSVVFAGAGGVYSQNNSGLFWDNANGRLGLGLGTSSPAYKLDVQGGADLLQLRRTSVRDFGFQITSSGDLNIYDETANADRLTLDASGNLGLGVTPTVQFHTTGGVRFAGLATSGSSTYTVKADATGNLWYDSSDESYKKNISAIPYGIAAVMQLNPVAYNFVEDDEPDLGFIAQDIYNIIPELTYTAQDGKFGVKYDKLVSVLTKAIQEQQAQIEQLKQRITQLENK